MASIRQFAGQTIIYGIGSILSKVVYYLLVVVLLTYLLDGRSYEFGTYAELYGYVTVLIILFSLKLDTALFRFGTDDSTQEEAFNTCASMVLISALFLVFIGFAFTSEIAAVIDYSDKPQYIRWFTLILAFDIIALIPFAKLRLENKARVFALLKIFNVVLSSLMILFFLIVFPRFETNSLMSWVPRFEYQIDYVFLTNLVASGVLLALLMFYVKAFRFSVSRDLFKKIVPYVLPLMIVGVCNNTIQYNGAAIIKYLSSGESLLENLGQSGVFDSSRRLAGLFVLFIGAFNYAAEPFFFNNSKKSDKEDLYGKISHLFVLVGGMLILSMVLGLDLIKYMVGEEFRESIFIIPILLLAYLFLGLYHNISIWYKLSDKTIWGAVISIFGLTVTIVVSASFIPSFGYVAFAWANLFSYLLMVILAYLLGQKFYPIKYPVFPLLKSITFLTLLIIGAIKLQELLEGISLYVTYAVILLSFAFYAFSVEKDEWKKLFSKNKS